MEVRVHPVSGYVFTENGEVYNPKNGYKLNPYVDRCGYCKVGVYVCSSGYVHRGMYEAFIGEIECGMQINHVDGNKENNHISNLEKVTRSGNIRHAYDTGLMIGGKGSKNSMSKITERDVLEIYKMIEDGKNNTEIANQYGLHSRYISLIRHGKRWKHLYDEYYTTVTTIETTL